MGDGPFFTACSGESMRMGDGLEIMLEPPPVQISTGDTTLACRAAYSSRCETVSELCEESDPAGEGAGSGESESTSMRLDSDTEELPLEESTLVPENMLTEAGEL